MGEGTRKRKSDERANCKSLNCPSEKVDHVVVRRRRVPRRRVRLVSNAKRLAVRIIVDVANRASYLSGASRAGERHRNRDCRRA